MWVSEEYESEIQFEFLAAQQMELAKLKKGTEMENS